MADGPAGGKGRRGRESPRLKAELLALKNQAKREGWAKWIRSEADERAMLDKEVGAFFNVRRAEHIVDFFHRYLRHSKGPWAGKAFEVLPWQRNDLLMPLFGWTQGRKGPRRFNRCYVELPKKNGKSTLTAGIGLYMLTSDMESGAEIYSAGTDRDSASIVHGEAINMVRSSPQLSSILRINGNTKVIQYDATRSLYKALSHRPAGKEGLNAHAILCDELHVWKGRELWDTLRYAYRARTQPLLWVITTAGADVESVCYEQHEYALKIGRGEVYDPKFFPLVHAAEPGEDHADPKVWKRCNPSLGTTFTLKSLKEDYRSAKRSTGELAAWKRYTLNVWGGGIDPWLKAGAWDACASDYTLDEMEGACCYAGLDLARVDDLSALVLVFPDADDPELLWLWPHFWAPEAVIRSKAERAPEFAKWAAEGLIEATPGEVTDYAFIRRRLADVNRRFKLLKVAFDPYFSESIVGPMQDDHGFDVSQLVAFHQYLKNYAEPTGESERRILVGKIRHPNHAVLNSQMRYAMVKTDANGAARPWKPARGKIHKNDGVVATVMGVALAMTDKSEREKSVYERGGGIKFL